MLSSRERVEAALNHRQADRVPVDLGGTTVTGIHVSSVYQLRQALALDPPGTPVRVIEPFMMLGEAKADLLDALGVDTVRVGLPTNIYGFRNDGWKPWTTFDGTPVLVPEKFPTDPGPNGELLMYPLGDRSSSPCARMPKGGFYFDAITRQDDLQDEDMDPSDNMEEFEPISGEALAHLRTEVERLAPMGRALVGGFGGMSFGDAAQVPGPRLRHPRGIRDLSEWYMSYVTRPEYIAEVFGRQCDIGLENLAKIYDVVGDAVTAVMVTAADFGAQNGPLVSSKTYRRLFQPVHAALMNGSIPTPSGRPSSTRAGRCGAYWTTSPTPGSTSSTPYRPRPPIWARRASRTVTGTASRFGAGAWTLSRYCPSAPLKTCGAWSASGCGYSAEVVVLSSAPFTTSRSECRWPTFWPCSRPSMNTARTP